MMRHAGRKFSGCQSPTRSGWAPRFAHVPDQLSTTKEYFPSTVVERLAQTRVNDLLTAPAEIAFGSTCLSPGGDRRGNGAGAQM